METNRNKQRSKVCRDINDTSSDYLDIGTAMKKWFQEQSNKVHLDVMGINHPFPNCSLPPHELSVTPISKLDPDLLKLREDGTWSLMTKEFFEAKVEEFDSNDLCFDNVKLSQRNITSSLVHCKLSLRTLQLKQKMTTNCSTTLCIPFCCGSVDEMLDNGERKIECHEPNNFVWIHRLPPLHLIRFKVIENGIEVTVDGSSIMPYQKDLNGKCNIEGDSQFQQTTISLDNASLVFKRSANGYQLRINDGFYKSSEYCIAPYKIPFGKNNIKQYKHLLKVMACKNKGWHQDILTKVCPILCGVSIIFIVIDILLHCKDRQRKLPDAIRLILLSHMLLFYILIALKAIDLYMLDYDSSVCTFVGLARHFFYLSIVSWIAALSHSTCAPFLSFNASVRAINHDPQGFSDSRFKWYFLFSSGLPCLVSLLTIVTMSYDGAERLSKPPIGLKSCGFSGKNDYAIYFHVLPSTMTILLALLVWVRFTIRYCGVTWNQNDNENIRTTNMKQKIKVAAKAFGVIGMFWCIDTISNFIEIFLGTHHTITLVYSTIFDSFSYLNGLWFFLANNYKVTISALENVQAGIQLEVIHPHFEN